MRIVKVPSRVVLLFQCGAAFNGRDGSWPIGTRAAPVSIPACGATAVGSYSGSNSKACLRPEMLPGRARKTHSASWQEATPGSDQGSSSPPLCAAARLALAAGALELVVLQTQHSCRPIHPMPPCQPTCGRPHPPRQRLATIAALPIFIQPLSSPDWIRRLVALGSAHALLLSPRMGAVSTLPISTVAGDASLPEGHGNKRNCHLWIHTLTLSHASARFHILSVFPSYRNSSWSSVRLRRLCEDGPVRHSNIASLG